MAIIFDHQHYYTITWQVFFILGLLFGFTFSQEFDSRQSDTVNCRCGPKPWSTKDRQSHHPTQTCCEYFVESGEGNFSQSAMLCQIENEFIYKRFHSCCVSLMHNAYCFQNKSKKNRNPTQHASSNPNPEHKVLNPKTPLSIIYGLSPSNQPIRKPSPSFNTNPNHLVLEHEVFKTAPNAFQINQIAKPVKQSKPTGTARPKKSIVLNEGDLIKASEIQIQPRPGLVRRRYRGPNKTTFAGAKFQVVDQASRVEPTPRPVIRRRKLRVRPEITTTEMPMEMKPKIEEIKLEAPPKIESKPKIATSRRAFDEPEVEIPSMVERKPEVVNRRRPVRPKLDFKPKIERQPEVASRRRAFESDLESEPIEETQPEVMNRRKLEHVNQPKNQRKFDVTNRRRVFEANPEIKPMVEKEPEVERPKKPLEDRPEVKPTNRDVAPVERRIDFDDEDALAQVEKLAQYEPVFGARLSG